MMAVVTSDGAKDAIDRMELAVRGIGTRLARRSQT